MKYTLNQKCIKTGTLLMGLREPDVAKYLRKRGFTEEVLKEGWGLFYSVVRARLKRAPARTRDKTLLKMVAQFEKEWFPIVQLALTRHFPAMSAELRTNLQRSDGNAVTWSVSFFLERLNEMNDPDGPFGADGPAARTLLEERGLTDEVVAPVAEAVGQLDSFAQPMGEADAAAPDIRAAEEAMWSWYLEWSGIARRDIGDGNILRSLGLSKRRNTRSKPDKPDNTDASEELVLNSNVVTATPALPAAELPPVVAPLNTTTQPLAAE